MILSVKNYNHQCSLSYFLSNTIWQNRAVPLHKKQTKVCLVTLDLGDETYWTPVSLSFLFPNFLALLTLFIFMSEYLFLRVFFLPLPFMRLFKDRSDLESDSESWFLLEAFRRLLSVSIELRVMVIVELRVVQLLDAASSSPSGRAASVQVRRPD